MCQGGDTDGAVELAVLAKQEHYLAQRCLRLTHSLGVILSQVTKVT